MPVCFPLLWCGEQAERGSPIQQGCGEKQEKALPELGTGGSAVDSLSCSSVAIFM